MKHFVVFSLLLLADFLTASPLLHRDNDGYRWALSPDSEGNIHLLDLNPIDTPVEPHFDAATDTIFILFTRRNPTVGQIITWNRDVLENSNFNPSHPTRFTIHGWNGDRTARVNTFVAEEYFRYGEYNMITVDWSIGGNTLNYITARNRVQSVAVVVSSFIDYLGAFEFLRFSELHIIGHSLGGQIAGLTGKRVTRGVIQVIMALDPAGPLFSVSNPEERVASTDAVYVEVIHTNRGRLGFSEPIGDADFFPNFGVIMPGCESDITGQCSHSRSHLFYAESINRAFTSQECTSFAEIDNGQCTPTGRTARMGGPHGNIGLTGLYFLTTNDASPFSRG